MARPLEVSGGVGALPTCESERYAKVRTGGTKYLCPNLPQ